MHYVVHLVVSEEKQQVVKYFLQTLAEGNHLLRFLPICMQVYIKCILRIITKRSEKLSCVRVLVSAAWEACILRSKDLFMIFLSSKYFSTRSSLCFVQFVHTSASNGKMHHPILTSIYSRRLLFVAFILCSFYNSVFGLQNQKIWPSVLCHTTTRNLTIKKMSVYTETMAHSDARKIVKTLLEATLLGWPKSPYHKYRK